MKVVVFEESEAARRSLVAALEGAGAAGVAQAADLAALDGALAEAGGVAVVLCAPARAEAVVKATPGALVVCAAGPDATDAAVAALAGLAFDVLPLPVDAAEASAVLVRALEQAGAEEAAAAAARELQTRRAELGADVAALAGQETQRPRLDRLRAELSAGVVAELAASIAPVQAWLERAADEVGDSPAGSAIVDSLFAAEAAVRMVSDLHDAVRSERAPLPVARELLGTTAFVDSVLACVARVASDYEATIDVVRHDRADEFSADPRLLRRALENMLECGLRRSRKGRLRLEVSGSEGAVRFDVIDGGGPVPEYLLPALFTRLARLDGGTIQRGAALGFCRAAAQALGGSVHAVADGPGLRLTLLLPRRAVEIAA